uniref:Uncharacterized protein n=1 Tax=Salmonella sp. TaxID=599 RepID=A0A482EU75_SALSP|nr:hypothetical protein [Salmonella sp.]QBM91374.1 hypothetical protein NNIBIDOC_00041 [Salmonella sp.]
MPVLSKGGSLADAAANYLKTYEHNADKYKVDVFTGASWKIRTTTDGRNEPTVIQPKSQDVGEIPLCTSISPGWCWCCSDGNKAVLDRPDGDQLLRNMLVTVSLRTLTVNWQMKKSASTSCSIFLMKMS